MMKDELLTETLVVLNFCSHHVTDREIPTTVEHWLLYRRRPEPLEPGIVERHSREPLSTPGILTVTKPRHVTVQNGPGRPRPDGDELFGFCR